MSKELLKRSRELLDKLLDHDLQYGAQTGAAQIVDDLISAVETSAAAPTTEATPPATAAGPSDAERYQWLRENNVYSIHDRLFADCPMNKFNDAMLDAAIDAAIRATKGGKL